MGNPQTTLLPLFRTVLHAKANLNSASPGHPHHCSYGCAFHVHIVPKSVHPIRHRRICRQSLLVSILSQAQIQSRPPRPTTPTSRNPVQDSPSSNGDDCCRQKNGQVEADAALAHEIISASCVIIVPVQYPAAKKCLEVDSQHPDTAASRTTGLPRRRSPEGRPGQGRR